MAQDIFLKIDGIAGESQDATHPDEIEVLGWSWNVTQKSTMHSGSGGGAARLQSRICILRTRLTAQARILRVIAFRGSIPKVLLTMRKAGGLPLEYLKITLFDVIVTHVEPAAGAGLALEHVALSFARMKKEYVVCVCHHISSSWASKSQDKSETQVCNRGYFCCFRSLSSAL
jgi:type VI secretion system secreted protein Hcp